MAMLLGKKVGMTQVYDEAGNLFPVTVIQAGPCTVMQVKTHDSDGYCAIQLGYDDVKQSRRNKPALKHAEKASTLPKKFVREERLNEVSEDMKAGDLVTASVFSDIEYVDVVGTSKGKGFAGTMKRHSFRGFPASHGTERKHRAPGSLASMASDRGHGGNIKKGKRMSGHMGHERVTTKNHKLLSIDEEKNLLIVKGPVAGPAGGYVIINSSKKA
jgi:large subunit ribosomal protein L3